jgi:hypothetical protein
LCSAWPSITRRWPLRARRHPSRFTTARRAKRSRCMTPARIGRIRGISDGCLQIFLVGHGRSGGRVHHAARAQSLSAAARRFRQPPGPHVLGRSRHAEHYDHVGGVGGMKARYVLTDITNLATMRARAIPSSTHTRPRGLANCCVGRRDPKGASRKDTSEGPPRRSGGPSLITKVLVTRPFSRPTVNPVAATDSSLLLVESRRR